LGYLSSPKTLRLSKYQKPKPNFIMKEMKPDQIRKAMVEIIIGNPPSKLKVNYPEHYQHIRNVIVDIHSVGGRVKIP